LNWTVPLKLQALVGSGVEEGVTVGVTEGFGFKLTATTLTKKTYGFVGVTEGVGVIVGVTVTVGVGVGGTAQSKTASKSNAKQGDVGTGVITQTPELKNSLYKSGQVSVIGLGPNNSQGSPKFGATHHLSSVPE
jgi:hypothetical protein